MHLYALSSRCNCVVATVEVCENNVKLFEICIIKYVWHQSYVFTLNNVIVLKLIVHHKFPHMWNGVIKEDQLSTVNGNSLNVIIVFPI